MTESVLGGRARARFAIDAIKAAEVVLQAFRERNEMQLREIHFLGENRYDPETRGWAPSTGSHSGWAPPGSS